MPHRLTRIQLRHMLAETVSGAPGTGNMFSQHVVDAGVAALRQAGNLDSLRDAVIGAVEHAMAGIVSGDPHDLGEGEVPLDEAYRAAGSAVNHYVNKFLVQHEPDIMRHYRDQPLDLQVAECVRSCQRR